MNQPTKQVVVISGPTGSGESTVTKEIISRHPNFVRLVTATSRPKRLKEEHGVDYYFFTEEEFKNEIEKGDIIEYQTNRSANAYYGTYKPDLDKKLAAGNIIIANTDIIGTRFYKKSYNATTIFIAPESLEEIKTRLLSREPDMDPEKLEARMAYAKRELEEESPFYDYQVVNRQNKLQDTVARVEEILKKEGFLDNA
ncbi:MAG: guanylate kinase [Patescibacteria group bacterium]